MCYVRDLAIEAPPGPRQAQRVYQVEKRLACGAKRRNLDGSRHVSMLASLSPVDLQDLLS